jgi:hypothetical protein
MPNFVRVIFGLNGTDDRIRRARSSYGILGVLWLVLGASRLFRPDPFTGWNLVGIVLSILVVLFLAATVILKTLELRRRS